MKTRVDGVLWWGVPLPDSGEGEGARGFFGNKHVTEFQRLFVRVEN
jgi:hypothetical protein